ncbi:hypothetical protein JCM3766R1_002410 [Sporobolomyces carnicolor]
MSKRSPSPSSSSTIPPARHDDASTPSHHLHQRRRSSSSSAAARGPKITRQPSLANEDVDSTTARQETGQRPRDIPLENVGAVTTARTGTPTTTITTTTRRQQGPIITRFKSLANKLESEQEEEPVSRHDYDDRLNNDDDDDEKRPTRRSRFESAESSMSTFAVATPKTSRDPLHVTSSSLASFKNPRRLDEIELDRGDDDERLGQQQDDDQDMMFSIHEPFTRIRQLSRRPRPGSNEEGQPDAIKRRRRRRGGGTLWSFIASLIVALTLPGLWLAFVGRGLWIHDRPRGIGIVIVFAYLTLISWSSLFKASLSDPGVLPRGLDPNPPRKLNLDNDNDHDRRGAADEEARGQGDEKLVAEIKYLRVRQGVVGSKWCETCETYRPPRTSHCRLCDNCVELTDHHCAYLNNCIGRKNYYPFICFLVSTTLILLYSIAFTSYYLSMTSRTRTTSRWDFIASCVVLVLVVAVTVPVGGLLVYHSRLILTNQTTIEMLRPKSSRGGLDPSTGDTIENLWSRERQDGAVLLGRSNSDEQEDDSEETKPVATNATTDDPFHDDLDDRHVERNDYRVEGGGSFTTTSSRRPTSTTRPPPSSTEYLSSDSTATERRGGRATTLIGSKSLMGLLGGSKLTSHSSVREEDEDDDEEDDDEEDDEEAPPDFTSRIPLLAASSSSTTTNPLPLATTPRDAASARAPRASTSRRVVHPVMLEASQGAHRQQQKKSRTVSEEEEDEDEESEFGFQDFVSTSSSTTTRARRTTMPRGDKGSTRSLREWWSKTTRGVGGIKMTAKERALWRWVNVEDLDQFLDHVYRYYQGKGIWTIGLEKVLNLLTVGWVIGFSSFLIGCVDYPRLWHADRLSEAVFDHCGSLSTTWSRSKGFVVMFALFVAVYAWRVFEFLATDVKRLWDMHEFYTELLQIPEDDIQTIPWHSIVTRLSLLRADHPSAISSRQSSTRRGGSGGGGGEGTLDAHSVANRIMRSQNYLIALLNAGPPSVLDFSVPVPNRLPRFLKRYFFSTIDEEEPRRRGQHPRSECDDDRTEDDDDEEDEEEDKMKKRKRSIELTRALEWNLNWAVLGFVFDERGFVREIVLNERKRDQLIKALENRFILVGLLNALFAPFIVVYLLIYSFFRYFEEYHKNPSSLSSRQFTPLAMYKFRSFNELDHEFSLRLATIRPLANLYLSSYPRAKTALVSRFVAFLAGSFAAVLIAFSLIDPDAFLHFEVTEGRTTLFWIGLLGGIVAIARGMSTSASGSNNSAVEGVDQFKARVEPGNLMKDIVELSRYCPKEWEGNLHAYSVHQSFAPLFPPKPILFLQELASVLLTPLILIFTLPKCAPNVIDFFREFTVEVEGLGRVFDLKNDGARRPPPGTVQEDPRAVDGSKLTSSGGERRSPLFSSDSTTTRGGSRRNPRARNPSQPPPPTTTTMLSTSTRLFKNMENKMEKSLLNFAVSNPDWQPRDEAQSLFLSQMLSEHRSSHGAAVTQSQQQHHARFTLKEHHDGNRTTSAATTRGGVPLLRKRVASSSSPASSGLLSSSNPPLSRERERIQEEEEEEEEEDESVRRSRRREGGAQGLSGTTAGGGDHVVVEDYRDDEGSGPRNGNLGALVGELYYRH